MRKSWIHLGDTISGVTSKMAAAAAAPAADGILVSARKEDYVSVKSALIDFKNRTKLKKKASLCEDRFQEASEVHEIDLHSDDCGNAGTLLHYAALWGWTDVVTYLVESEGLKVNLPNKKSGKTPFMLSVENGQIPAALLLLMLGADALARNNNGYTALHYAIMSNDYETVRFTYWAMKRAVKYENCLPVSGGGEAPAVVKSPNPSNCGIQQEVQSVDVSGGERPNNTSASTTSSTASDHTTEARDILNAENDVKVTPLMVAVAYGRVNSTRALLDLGACVKSCDADRNTPLILVSQHCTVEQCKVNWLNRSNYSSNDEDLMVLLLDRGSDPNATNFKGRSALHYAVLNERMDMIQMLLRSGASVMAKDCNGETPRDLAAKSENEEIRAFMCMSLSKIIRVIVKLPPFPRPVSNGMSCYQKVAPCPTPPVLCSPGPQCPGQMSPSGVASPRGSPSARNSCHNTNLPGTGRSSVNFSQCQDQQHLEHPPCQRPSASSHASAYPEVISPPPGVSPTEFGQASLGHMNVDGVNCGAAQIGGDVRASLSMPQETCCSQGPFTSISPETSPMDIHPVGACAPWGGITVAPPALPCGHPPCMQATSGCGEFKCAHMVRVCGGHKIKNPRCPGLKRCPSPASANCPAPKPKNACSTAPSCTSIQKCDAKGKKRKKRKQRSDAAAPRKCFPMQCWTLRGGAGRPRGRSGDHGGSCWNRTKKPSKSTARADRQQSAVLCCSSSDEWTSCSTSR